MVFLFILLILCILLLIIVFSKIRIDVKKFEYCSANKKHINPNYYLQLSWIILNKIPIIKIKLNKYTVKKLKLKDKFVDIDIKMWEERKKLDKETISIIKKIDFAIKKLKLKIDIGTENSAITSLLIPIISTLISFLLRNKMKTKEEQTYIVQPIYKDQNYLNITISGIFDIKMNHIINVIYLLSRKNKKGVKKYERTSNRRSYDYSYE